MAKLTEEQSKALAIILIAVFGIVIASVFASKGLKFLSDFFGQSEADKKYEEAQNKIINVQVEDQKKQAAESARRQAPTRPANYFISAAKTIEDNLAFDTASALNRNEDAADLAFTSAINNDADFDALVSAYGVRPYKTLFGKKTDVKADLLNLLKTQFGEWRIKRTNEILAKKGVTRRV